MGRWGTALLESDGASDGTDAVANSVVSDLRRYAHTKSKTARTPARVAAAIGVLIQIAPHLLHDRDVNAFIRAAVDKHLDGMRKFLAPEVVTVVNRAVDPNTKTRFELPEAHVLSRLLTSSGLGSRQSVLFSHASGRRYVQKIAIRCSRALREVLWVDDFDPVEDERWMGPLAVLVMIEPWSLPPESIVRWHKRVAMTIRRMRSENASNPDLSSFEEEILPKVWEAFELIRDRAESDA